MKIMLHGAHIELTPAIKTYVEEKLGGISEVLDPKHEALSELRVEIGRPSQHHQHGNVFYAEANLKIGAMLYRATSNHEDVRTAINEVRDDLERQLQKNKTK